MKKIFLFLFLTNSYFAMAQSFISVKAAYAFGRNESVSVLSEKDGGITIENFALGTGIHPELSWIFCLSENFGITVDASFLLGKKISVNENIYAVNQMPQPYFTPDNNGMVPMNTAANISAFSLKTQGLYISPSLLISTGGDGFDFYSKIGFSLPVYNNTELGYTHQDQVLGKVVATELDLKTSFSIGFKAALGANIEMNKSFGFFAELAYLGMNVQSKTAEVTSYKIDGKEDLSKLGNAKTINYSETVPANSNNNTQNAREELRFPVSYNSLSFGLGLRYRFAN